MSHLRVPVAHFPNTCSTIDADLVSPWQRLSQYDSVIRSSWEVLGTVALRVLPKYPTGIVNRNC